MQYGYDLSVLMTIRRIRRRNLLVVEHASAIGTKGHLGHVGSLRLLRCVRNARLQLVRANLVLIYRRGCLMNVNVGFLYGAVFQRAIRKYLNMLSLVVKRFRFAKGYCRDISTFVTLLNSMLLGYLTMLGDALAQNNSGRDLNLSARFIRGYDTRVLRSGLGTLYSINFIRFCRSYGLTLNDINLTPEIVLSFLVSLVRDQMFNVILRRVRSRAFLGNLLRKMSVRYLTLAPNVRAAGRLGNNQLQDYNRYGRERVNLLTITFSFVKSRVFRVYFSLFTKTRKRNRDHRVLAYNKKVDLIGSGYRALVFRSLRTIGSVQRLLGNNDSGFNITIRHSYRIDKITLIVRCSSRSNFVLRTRSYLLRLTISGRAINSSSSVVGGGPVVDIIRENRTIDRPYSKINLTKANTILGRVVLHDAIFASVNGGATSGIRLVVAQRGGILKALRLANLFVSLFLRLSRCRFTSRIRGNVLNRGVFPRVKRTMLILGHEITYAHDCTLSITRIRE